MNNIFIDVDYAQIYKYGQKIGGDVFLLSRENENNKIVCTLSDGLGSGVKANVLASLTAHMAHKLSFSPIDVACSAEIIMNTLPVCKERKISYSTFTIANISYKANMEKIIVKLVEYDNPLSLRFNDSDIINFERDTKELQRKTAFKKEIIQYSNFDMQIGERLIIFSDGVSQAGIGKSLPLGWRLSGVKSFVHDLIKENPDISSRELSKAIVQRANSLDGLTSKDDITAVVIYIRRPRKTLIVTGPPYTKETDEILGEKLKAFEGKKIISGGTTALIASRLLNQKIKVDLSCWSKEVPPCSKMEGVDLVTEGMITLSKVANVLENKIDVSLLKNDPVKKFIQIIQDSDQIHFIVGTKINEAHQDPNIPVEIGIRRTIISRLTKALENNYLKETSVEYL